MAYNNQNDIIEMTELGSLTIFGQEKKNTRRIAYGLFNDNDAMYFQIKRQDPDSNDNKFSKVFNVIIKTPMTPWSVYRIARKMQKRLKLMEKGENVPNKSLVIHNKRSIKDCTSKVEFNAFLKEGKQYILIKLAKRKDENVDWKEATEDTFFFGTGSLFYNSDKEDIDIEDKEVYAFFLGMCNTCEALASRTSTTRDSHLQKFFKSKYGESSNTNSNSSSNNKSSNSADDDDDDFPF